MRRRGIAAGLIFAGFLVILVGLGVVAVQIFELPRYWTPVVVGTAFLIAGATLRASQRRRPWRRT